uniref:Putative ovule protein n=1 Tax=Solanum chacoense TaxID=4108 RepID=A0A0V0HE86_SOLCH
MPMWENYSKYIQEAKSSSETAAIWTTVEINLSLCLSSNIHPDARNKHLYDMNCSNNQNFFKTKEKEL